MFAQMIPMFVLVAGSTSGDWSSSTSSTNGHCSSSSYATFMSEEYRAPVDVTEQDVAMPSPVAVEASNRWMVFSPSVSASGCSSECVWTQSSSSSYFAPEYFLPLTRIEQFEPHLVERGNVSGEKLSQPVGEERAQAGFGAMMWIEPAQLNSRDGRSKKQRSRTRRKK